MTAAEHIKDLSLSNFDLPLLRGGPLYSLLVRARIVQSECPSDQLRILLFIALTWFPLVLITLQQGTFLNSTIKIPFLYDFSESVRFLFVLPVLFIAEGLVEPWLGCVVAQCRRLVPEASMEKFNSYIAMAIRNRDSVPAELFLLLLAFIRPHIGDMTLPADITSWRSVTTSSGTEPSIALLYYLYVAKPLFSFLVFRWLWKFIIWSRLLIRISTLPLRINPTHPDHMGGLGFIGVGQVMFAIIYFAFAAQAASYVGEEIAFAGGNLMSFKYLIGGFVVLGPIIFLTPCLAFTPMLVQSKKRGQFEYSALAGEYTQEFHEKWIAGKRDDNEPLVGSADIQSLADMSNSYEVVRSMKTAVIGKSTLLSFVAASLIPFIPLILTVYPFDELVARLWKIVM